MPDATAPQLPRLFSVEVQRRAALALFDIADDPEYVALEVQRFEDDIHGTGVLVLLGRRDGRVDIYRQASLRLERRPFSIGRGIGEWQTAEIEPAILEVAPDGLHLEVGLTDAAGRRIEARIDDRAGNPRRRSTLLAPVSSGVERPEQLLIVLLRRFDLGRTSGLAPRLAVDGVARRITPLPGPAWLHRRRFIRSSGAPVIVSVNPTVDGPVDPASLGPVDEVAASDGDATARLRLAPGLPDLRAMVDGTETAGRWSLDVADVRGLTGGTWTARRAGSSARVELAVTDPWRPRGLPPSIRLVTTLARVFRSWPTTYRWSSTVDLAATPPVATARWERTTAPDRVDPYGVRRR